MHGRYWSSVKCEAGKVFFLFYGWFFQLIDCFLAYRSFWVSWSPTCPSCLFPGWPEYHSENPYLSLEPQRPHPFFQEFQLWHWDLWSINHTFLLPCLWSWDETKEIFRSKFCMKIHLQSASPKSSWKFRFGVRTSCPRLRKDGQKRTKLCLRSYSGELGTLTDSPEMAKTQWSAQCHLLCPSVAVRVWSSWRPTLCSAPIYLLLPVFLFIPFRFITKSSSGKEVTHTHTGTYTHVSTHISNYITFSRHLVYKF